jgi:hypothetical protein
LGIKEIISSIEKDEDKLFELECSYIEIYNDRVYDLLTIEKKAEKQELFV